MSWRYGLGRQLLVTMTVLVLIVLALGVAGSYIGYILLLTFTPEMEDSWIPSGPELLTLAATIFLALLIAARGAFSLAARILVPLNSVAEGARRIADGDLTARAESGDQAAGEIRTLVQDFNTMAGRLNDMSRDVATWNASIAHELRTPLTILKGRLQGIADGVFQPDPAMLRNLMTQVDGLARLAEDLRLVTLANSGQLRLQIERLDLAAEAADVVDAMKPMIMDSGFDVWVDLVEVSVPGDRTRIRQALIALIHNALRHADPGTLLVCTSIDGGMAVLEVEDEGPGLPDGAAEVIFQPFGQVQTRGAEAGSGLGLSVVRAIAEAMGGKASCATAKSGGAVFRIILPLSDTRQEV